MNYGTIKKNDIANGVGVRVSLFVSGCTHHCPGCFNEEAWDFNFGKPFTFHITQVIGLTNNDAVSKEHRPFKQMIERLNRTYKASYRHTNGFDNIDGANYELALWVAYYNFLRPHKHNQYKVLNEVEMLAGADNMPGKWQLLIFLGQQTILNMQKNGMAEMERGCCQ